MDDSHAHKFHRAAADNEIAVLRALLADHPEAVEIENEHGEAPLVSAAVAGSIDCIKLLLERGADPCRQKGFALTCACYHGHPDVVRALLAGGAGSVVQQVRRWHGLHAACGWGEASKPNAEVVQLLLETGANPQRVFEGRTPLQYAHEAGKSDIVVVLREHEQGR